MSERQARIELLWIPVGAGSRAPVVRWSGHAYEALVARAEHRPPCPLFHSALEVQDGLDRYVIEMTPGWCCTEPDRGVAAEGAVGSRLLRRSALFRYEVRRWLGGRIPDRAYAVDGPLELETDPARVGELLRLVPSVPSAVWGRDELGTGEMWNSNSVVSWLLVASGHDVDGVAPPCGGRAPGWMAGRVVAERQCADLCEAPGFTRLTGSGLTVGAGR